VDIKIPIIIGISALIIGFGLGYSFSWTKRKKKL